MSQAASKPASPASAPDTAEDDRTVCFCHNVVYCDLVKAIQDGATTLEEIQARTCASTGCGGCEWDVVEILQETLDRGRPGTGGTTPAQD